MKFFLKYLLYKLNIVISHNIKTQCNLLQTTIFNIIIIIIIATETMTLLPGKTLFVATTVSVATAKLPCKHGVTTAGGPLLCCSKQLLRTK